jgi:hypothetical protein
MVTVDELQEKGWLDENGICCFPEDVKAAVLGFKSPTLPIAFFSNATKEQLDRAVSKGWIKFFDGNRAEYTFDEYVARYPSYPDPIFQLELRGTWPPKKEDVFVIGSTYPAR